MLRLGYSSHVARSFSTATVTPKLVVGAPKFCQKTQTRIKKSAPVFLEPVKLSHNQQDRPAVLSYPMLGVTSEKGEAPTESPVFAVVDVKGKQFKVTKDDALMVDHLNFVGVNEPIVFNRVMLLGSRHETTIGRPVIPEAAVLATVEEHTQTSKVLIFKKRRRTSNSQRTRGFRAQVTILRINEIYTGQGAELPAWLSPEAIAKSRLADTLDIDPAEEAEEGSEQPAKQ